MKMLLQRISICVPYSRNCYHPSGTFTEEELCEELCAEDPSETTALCPFNCAVTVALHAESGWQLACGFQFHA